VLRVEDYRPKKGLVYAYSFVVISIQLETFVAMSANQDESFLTVAEVADWFKVNQQTVRNWIDQGRLPAVRVGRRVRIRRSDFDRILEDGTRGGSPSPSAAPPARSAGPSAADFWSGEPVGVADPAPSDEHPGPSPR
jgi:excisionase family DNA binding protein